MHGGIILERAEQPVREGKGGLLLRELAQDLALVPDVAHRNLGPRFLELSAVALLFSRTPRTAQRLNS